MTLVSAIAIILSQLPVPAADRDEENRNARIESIAIAIARASERATCTGEFASPACKPIASNVAQVASELAVLADAETNLRSNVHRGKCGNHQCDAVHRNVNGVVQVIHRARSLWQLHRAPSWTDEKWDGLLGATQSATDSAAWEATKLLAGYRTRCGGTAGAFAGYATGAQCSHKSAQLRADRTASVRVRIQTLRASQ